MWLFDKSVSLRQGSYENILIKVTISSSEEFCTAMEKVQVVFEVTTFC